MQPGLSASHWRVPLPGGGLLELYAPSRLRPLPPPGGRLAPCLRRCGDGETVASWVAAACALGAQLEEGPRQEPFGWEAWLRDPEGNRLLLLAGAPAVLASACVGITGPTSSTDPIVSSTSSTPPASSTSSGLPSSSTTSSTSSTSTSSSRRIATLCGAPATSSSVP